MANLENTQYFNVKTDPAVRVKEVLDLVYNAMAEKGYKEYKDKSNNSVFELETDIGKIIYEVDELTKTVTIKSIEM